MSKFLRKIIRNFDPDLLEVKTKDQEKKSPVKGVAAANIAYLKKYKDVHNAIENYQRHKILKFYLEMSEEGAIADKALEKLTQDATSNPVIVDSTQRRKKIIYDMLERVEYEKIRSSLLYLLARDGDEFLQLAFSPSSDPTKIGYITEIMRMPTDTMIRNTDERDKFSDDERSFIQVDSIANAMNNEIASFSWPSIIHARNDKLRSRFLRYGRSSWASSISSFHMFMMMLEDMAIQRHNTTHRVKFHLLGKNAQPPIRVDDEVIESHRDNYFSQVNERTTDVFIDGKHQVEELGGTTRDLSGVDDIAMSLSILSIALDYPLDLLSGMINKSSGGEELFRKEVVLKRAINGIIKKETDLILTPLIKRELMLNGVYGKFNLTTIPASFEDANKQSKRGLGELEAYAKSLMSYHSENNSEVSWDEEQKRIEETVGWLDSLAKKFPDGFGIIKGATGRKDPQSGSSGNTKDTNDQQERSTPGKYGNDEKEEAANA